MEWLRQHLLGGCLVAPDWKLLKNVCKALVVYGFGAVPEAWRNFHVLPDFDMPSTQFLCHFRVQVDFYLVTTLLVVYVRKWSGMQYEWYLENINTNQTLHLKCMAQRLERQKSILFVLGLQSPVKLLSINNIDSISKGSHIKCDRNFFGLFWPQNDVTVS